MKEKVVMDVKTWRELLGYKLDAFIDAHSNGIERNFDEWCEQFFDDLNEGVDYLPDRISEEAE